MQNAITPYSQWMQNIKYDLMNMFQSYKTIFIHRAKIACLCQDLSQFHRHISTQQYPQIPPQPSDATSLRQLVSSIAGLRALFASLDAQNAIQTVFKQPISYVKQYLNDFRKVFNGNVAALQLYPNPPCPIDMNQEKVDDLADCHELLDRLSGYAQATPLNPELTKILNMRIEETKTTINQIESVQNALIQKEELRNRPLSHDDLIQRLQPLQKWNVRQEDFELQKKIGSGGFADVFIGYQRSTRRVVAIKKLHNDDFTEATFEMFKREVEIFGSLNHFAVLPFVGVCLQSPYYIITEFMSGGCLFNRLHSKSDTKLDPTKRTIIALGCAYALEYIHKNNLLHRDIKSLNVLLDADDFPKLCDFGMSRTIAENKELMTGGVGTAQWMAPEILNSEPYDEKSDVYSYGILLWELLTADIPFRGMKDVQVAMAVISNQTRPIIPQDCPPKLNKFIKMCWDQEAQRRPDFGSIARAIESGEVVYPGTNMTNVIAYITRFQRPPSTAEVPSSLTKSSQGPDDQIINDLQRRLATKEALSAIKFIVSVLDDKEWVSKLVSSTQLLSSILDVADICQNTNMAADIISIFAVCSANAEQLPADTITRILNLFMRFGNSEMVQILVFIEQTMKLLIKNKLNANHINKLAPFLQASNADARIKMTQCSMAIISYKAYDSPESARYLVPYAIANIAPESMPDLLIPSIKLAQYIAQDTQLLNTFIDYGGLAQLANIIASSNSQEGIDIAYQLLISILSSVPISDKSITVLVASFPNAVMTIKSDTSLIKYISCFAFILAFKSTYRAVVKEDKFMTAIVHLLRTKYPNVVVLTLKLCFSFLSKATTFQQFASIAETEYLRLIESQVKPIAAMAAHCLVCSIPASKNPTVFYTQSIVQFLKNSLGATSELTSPGLRLSGTLANNKEGAQFLDNNGIIQLVTPFIGSTNGYHQKISIIVLSAFSSSFTMSQIALRMIPTFIQALQFEQLAPYPLIFLANMAIHPDGATKCAQSIGKFIQYLKSTDSMNVGRALVAISRILSCHESVSAITDSNAILELFSVSASMTEAKLFETFIDIVSTLSGTSIGRTTLTQTNLPQTLQDKMDQLPKNDPLRPAIMRILARC